MKLRFLTLVLCALVVGSMQAQKKKKKPGRTTIPVVVEPQLVCEAEPVDAKTYSIALGVREGAQLRKYIMEQERVEANFVNTAAKALLDDPNTDEAKSISAKAVGYKLARVCNEQIAPQINKEVTGDAKGSYLDLDLFKKTLYDMVVANNVTMSADSARKIIEKQEAYAKEAFKVRNQQWLIDNAKKDSVVTTATGLQYKIIRQGNGPTCSDTSHVELNYEGRLIDGTKFDSSFDRGETVVLTPQEVIRGWAQVLPLMPEGSRWEVYIPSELGYGTNGAGPIPANATLIFIIDVEKANTTKRMQ